MIRKKELIYEKSFRSGGNSVRTGFLLLGYTDTLRVPGKPVRKPLGVPSFLSALRVANVSMS